MKINSYMGTEDKKLVKEEFGLGNSVEEAKQEAISKLPSDVDYKIEIIEDYKPKVLGLFGGHPAKVRAYYEQREEKRVNKKPQKPAEKVSRAEKAKKQPEKTSEKKAEVKIEAKSELNYIPFEQIDKESPAAHSAAYLKSILEKMGITELSIKIAEIENGSQLLIEGENLGVVIGRRGETLDALQYLASFVANAKQAGYYRIVLDIGNYREKREDTLKSLAVKVSEQVIRTGRNRSLEPMNPYERRIIHTEVQKIEGVDSGSVGDGDNRHVVIFPEGGSLRRTDNRRRNSGRGRQNGRGRQSRPSNKVEAPARAPRSDVESDAPLYGKIN